MNSRINVKSLIGKLKKKNTDKKNQNVFERLKIE
jgi:hypothetical protein